jgi:hypothetical protein
VVYPTGKFWGLQGGFLAIMARSYREPIGVIS